MSKRPISSGNSFKLMNSNSFAALYMPELNSFHQGCVMTGAGQNDTFFSQYLHTIAFDLAAFKGNDSLNRGILNYNAQSSSMCSDQRQKTTVQYTQLLDSMSTINATANHLRESLILLESCVNITALDNQYQVYCNYSSTNRISNISKLCSPPSFAYSNSYMPPHWYLKSTLNLYEQINAALNNSTAPGDDDILEKFTYTQSGNFSKEGWILGLRDSTFDCTKLPTCMVRTFK